MTASHALSQTELQAHACNRRDILLDTTPFGKTCPSSLPIILIFVLAMTLGVIPPGVSAAAENAPIDLDLAARYFQEADRICKQDDGKLWGISLCGPMLFVNRATRRVAASQEDSEGRLKKSGEVFVGVLPADVTTANTSMEWAGVHWTMILWPRPQDQFDRDQLMMHELWHRVQGKLGLSSAGPPNNHLDTNEGRLWLQLEWRALARALTKEGPARRTAIRDALIFRLYRRPLFPDAASEEWALEMHEGLAEYTGVKLSGRPDLDQYCAQKLKTAANDDTLVRSFAYASGPAYGLLMDDVGVDWRKNLNEKKDLGVLLSKAYSIDLAENLKTAA